MASGWANDGAVQDQIDSTVDDAVARARNALPSGESHKFCDECGEPIPEARRKAIPGVRYCVRCQQEKDLHNNTFSGYNRRGSKDSQLR
ncbi:DksA/TraR family C4-type zinc finger protein [Raoultella planticola]|uniref:DksA/TraR family C4-type zinc finger protein n=1 Tax=Raoultella planticola TaxID=575 RepID=UPI001E2A68DC|nr:DksA/TraR family C4-type zinc finger protein [Raoultella planticola]MCD9607280.1 DksA/TraR family C4-type zinc finger protein [Raoultella planticola]HDG9772762.1 DksA/TraR family C4-type zinc finger protein [Raoultella planticola]HED2410592.1 DksA/TraR family C4-type zinc finger protein [Raoultella planticola]